MGTPQTKYEWFLISGFIEDFLRIGQKLHKIAHNAMKNRGSSSILTNLVGVHPRNIQTKFEANPCSGLREVKKLKSSRRRRRRRQRRTQYDRLSHTRLLSVTKKENYYPLQAFKKHLRFTLISLSFHYLLYLEN